MPPASDDEPVDGKRLIELGREREGRGDLRGAENAYGQAVGDVEHQVEAALLRARALARLQLKAEALNSYQSAVGWGLVPGSRDVHLASLAALELAPDLETGPAIKLYRQVVDAGDPELAPAAALALGRAQIDSGDRRGAEDALRIAIERGDPATAGLAVVALGDAFQLQGEREQALQAYAAGWRSESDAVREAALDGFRNLGVDPPPREDPPTEVEAGVEAGEETGAEAGAETGAGQPDAESSVSVDEPESSEAAELVEDVEAQQPGEPSEPQAPAQQASGPTARVDPWLTEPPPLIGRRTEAERLVRRLSAAFDPDLGSPVVVVTGRPGVGKTILARHVFRAVRQRFPDGVRVVDLADSSPDTVNQALLAVAVAFGADQFGADQQIDAEPARETYARALAGRRVLLVLDHVSDPSVVGDFRMPEGPALLVITETDLGIHGAEHLRLHEPGREDVVGYLTEQARHGGTTLDVAALEQQSLLTEANDPFTVDLLGQLLRSFEFDRATSAMTTFREHLAAAISAADDAPETRRFVDSLSNPRRQESLALSLVPRPAIGIEPAAVALGVDSATAAIRLRDLADAGLMEASGSGEYLMPPAVRRQAAFLADQAVPGDRVVAAAHRRILRWLASADSGDRRSGYVSDMVGRGHLLVDDLDMGREIDALSWVVTAKDVSPPLSVGLFGVWGSGKSTFMELMQDKINRISAEARAARAAGREFPACAYVRQITFNAWHYADANLWASLVAHTFDELAKPAVGQSDPEQYHRLLERLETSQALRREAEQKRELATHERLERTEQLARVKHERSDARRDVERGGAPVKALAPTGELPGVAGRVADNLEEAGVEPGRVSAKDIRDGVAGLLADQELLRRVVAAIPDESTRTELLRVLRRPSIQDLLASAASGTVARGDLLAVLLDPKATEAARNLIPDEATRADVRELGDQLEKAYRGALELRAVATEVRGLWGNLRYLWRRGAWSIRGMIILAAFFGVLAVAGVITFFVGRFVLPSLPIAAMASAIAGIIGFTTVTMKAIRQPLRHIRAAVELAVETVDRKARRQIEQLEALESELQREIDTARRTEHEAEREIEDIRRGRRLQTYIQERASAGDYRAQLGVVAQVRKDFTRLAELMEQARLAREADAVPKAESGGQDAQRDAAGVESDDLPPIDRIVLYIDDLDRCPTDRVVQVLEAVHLLLALPLFVVVVGVDSRWLMQSLRHHYAAQLRGANGQQFTTVEDRSYWESTPQNYLEKIFQIPFSIRGMDKSGYGKLMEKLFTHADQQTASPGSLPPAAGSLPPSSPTATTFGPEPTAPRTSTQRRSTSVETPTAADVVTEPDPTTERVQDERHVPDAVDAPPVDAPPVDGPPVDAPPVDAPPVDAPPVDAPPQALSIADEEVRFLQALADFVPTPRAAKRLANTYRLIRVLLTPAEYVQYSAATDEHYKIVLTLLGILVGFPEQATTVFEAIITSPVGEWSTFKRDVIDKAGRTGHPPPPDTEEWERLSDALRDLDAAMSLPSSMAAYRGWARNVSRYSFHTGRLATLDTEPSART